MSGIEEVATYPKREEDVTALGLARYYAVLAQQRLGRIAEPGIDYQQEAIEVIGYVHEYALAGLLRAFVAANAYCADRAAQAIWRALDAGEMTGEQLWEWLTEWGIDPDTLRAADRSANGDDGTLPGM